MRLAPKRAGLRVGTYLLGGLAVGAALIALLPSNEQRVGLSTIASEATVLTPADPASAETTATSETTAGSDVTSSTAAPSESTSTSVAEPDEPTDPSRLPLPTNATEFSLAIEQAERMVRDETLSNPERDGWGRRQQSLYRHLTNSPEWADEVLARIDPTLTNAVSLNWGARQSLSSLVNTEHLQSELPAWRVLPPLPPEELIGYYKQAEVDTGIQWEFLAAINLIETRMGRIQGISTAGAVGPMQFLPTTWAECCEGDPAVPADAIAGAAKYLTDRGGPENMNRAIFGYNNSQYYVDAVTAYANVMMEDERAYYGYHAWEIYFLSTEGLIRIPVGYEQLEPIAAATWLAENPESLFTP